MGKKGPKAPKASASPKAAPAPAPAPSAAAPAAKKTSSSPKSSPTPPPAAEAHNASTVKDQPKNVKSVTRTVEVDDGSCELAHKWQRSQAAFSSVLERLEKQDDALRLSLHDAIDRRSRLQKLISECHVLQVRLGCPVEVSTTDRRDGKQLGEAGPSDGTSQVEGATSGAHAGDADCNDDASGCGDRVSNHAEEPEGEKDAASPARNTNEDDEDFAEAEACAEEAASAKDDDEEALSADEGETSPRSDAAQSCPANAKPDETQQQKSGWLGWFGRK